MDTKNYSKNKALLYFSLYIIFIIISIFQVQRLTAYKVNPPGLFSIKCIATLTPCILAFLCIIRWAKHLGDIYQNN